MIFLKVNIDFVYWLKKQIFSNLKYIRTFINVFFLQEKTRIVFHLRAFVHDASASLSTKFGCLFIQQNNQWHTTQVKRTKLKFCTKAVKKTSKLQYFIFLHDCDSVTNNWMRKFM